MKKIGITQRLVENSSYVEIRECLDERWGSLLHQAGFVPVPLLSNVPIEEIHVALKLDGILLSGGNDLASVHDNPLSRQRDAFEFSVLQFAIENQLPVLGICRGAQVIASYFGNHLVPVTGHVAVRHKVHIQPKSRFLCDYPDGTEVNSYHQYSFGSLMNGLRAVATTGDGVVEALEHVTYSILGINWHIEREQKIQDSDIALLRRFYE